MLTTIINGIGNFLSNLVNIIIGIILFLIKIATTNPYNFEKQFGSFAGYLIVMSALVIGVLIILGVIFLYMRRVVKNLTGMPILSASFSISMIIEVMGYFARVVTLEFFNIIADIVAFTLLFSLVFYLIYLASEKISQKKKGLNSHL